MKKGDIFEGKVIRTEFPNKGIIDIEGQKVIVKNALEGQGVRFSINKKKRDKIEGRLLEVIEPSPIEQPAACKHFGICGGCRYQNLSYEQQLDLKKRQVEELIEKSGLSFAIENIYGSPITEGYRNKMEFTFGDEEKDGPLALGMHKKNSFYDIVTLEDCRIVDPDFNVLLQAILKYFKEKGETYFHKIRHEGFLRHLVMRRSVKTGDILINLVTTTQSRLDESEFVNMILSQKIDGKVVGILHTLNDNLADVVQSDETKTLYGQDYFYEYLYNMRFKISPFSFFQTNTLGAEVLYDQVREYVGETKDKLVYDLYTGTGTIAQMLAPVASKVVGVEIVEEAGEDCNYIFGAKVEELETILPQYDSRKIFSENPKIRRVVERLIDGTLSDGGSGDFRELYYALLDGASWHAPDNYYLLGDLESYVAAKLRCNQDYQNRMDFAAKQWKNICNAGKFSSDRTIASYAKDIWQIDPVTL